MSTKKQSGRNLRQVSKPERRTADQRLKSSSVLSDKADGQRIAELRNALQLSQEAFARECKVSRIAVFRWESGQSEPSSKAWLFMAELARKVAPSTALWFWEKAGFNREALIHLFPEFEKSSREAVQRMREMASDPGGEFTRVPLLRDPLYLGKASLPSPEEVERWISLPKEFISNASATFAVRVSALFVRPIFGVGDIVVIDTAQIDVLKLDGALVAALYAPSTTTKRASEAVLRGAPAPANVQGTWPHLSGGLYLGWLKRNREGVHSHILESLSVYSDQFSVPVAVIEVDHDAPGGGELVPDEESGFLGRVICWMASPELAEDGTDSPSATAIGSSVRNVAQKNGAPEKAYVDKGKGSKRASKTHSSRKPGKK